VRKLTLSSSTQLGDGNISETQRSQLAKEVFIHSSTQWKGVFGRLLKDPTLDYEHIGDVEDRDDPGVVLHACADDMKRLWKDPVIRKLLEVQKLRVEEVAGLCFFSIILTLVYSVAD